MMGFMWRGLRCRVGREGGRNGREGGDVMRNEVIEMTEMVGKIREMACSLGCKKMHRNEES